MKNLLLLTVLCLFIISCSDNNTSERTNGYSHSNEPLSVEDSLMQTVMNGHDVAMAKMVKLAGMRKQIDAKADSLSKIKSEDKSKVQSLKDLTGRMQNAENEMNSWMDAFSVDTLKNEKEKRIAYLQSEIARVSKVKDSVLVAFAAADSVLKR